MAKHRTRHHRRRHNPLGISGSVVKDVAFNAAGMAAANFGAGFLGQSGWLDVAATAAAAVAVSYVGKSVAGAPASDELLKGGILAALIKAVKQAGVSVPGLGMYVNSSFPLPTASNPYGVLAPPVILAPPSGKLNGLRYRSRFGTRF